MHITEISTWILAGQNPNKYILCTENITKYEASRCLYSTEKDTLGYGTVLTFLNEKLYSGNRVKFSGILMGEHVNSYAGLWIRAESDTLDLFGFDNLYPHSLFGTTSWKEYHVVLDVPKDCNTLSLGIALRGSGKVWFKEMNLGIVDPTVPLTRSKKNRILLEGPTNLNFENPIF
ncbi:AraC family transcriptional regulator [Bacillus cereus group sp. BfR-BA-01331]|uniref:AraC family transcriptional regulator n=1 Tax=Bacillus cereus group sp. BfR-BA-01331 TaxID=2920307 RepID=UPI001F578DA3|nr:AraC family transcriptional regulator [Bacillus cereus group sp. BfR-BA-01331]